MSTLLTPDISDLLAAFNQKRLFKVRWRYAAKELSPMAYRQLMAQEILPIFRSLTQELLDHEALKPAILLTEYALPAEVPAPFRPFLGHELPSGHLVLFLVSMGKEFTNYYQTLEKAGRLRDYFFLHGIGAEGTETLATMAQAKVQKDFPTLALKRYAFGYPFCPDLSGNSYIMAALSASDYGIELSEHFMFVPEFTTAGVICLAA